MQGDQTTSSGESQSTTEQNLLEKLEAMQQAMATLTEELNTLKNPQVVPTAPPPPAQISVHSHKLIRELLFEIRTFDGTSNVEYFLDQLRNVRDQLDDEAEQKALLRKVIASKLIGEAARVGETVQGDSFSELANALRASFGQAELTYEQISEMRNNTRQGENESIDNYVKRYEELHRRVQKSIDQIKMEYRSGIRHIEDDTHIRRFIQSLKPDLEVRLLNMNITTLRQAIQEARAVAKRLRDDEVLRNKTKKNIIPDNFDRNKVKYENNKSEKNSFPNENKNKNLCNYCQKGKHDENQCWRKYPNLKNFQKRDQKEKGPPKYLMDDEEKLDTTQQEEINTTTCTSDYEGQQECTNSWWTQEHQNQL